MKHQLNVNFAYSHTCAAGHFPGNPIIPGALLLNTVLDAIALHLNIEHSLWDVKSAKFPQPARPGDQVEVRFDIAMNNAINFACTVSSKIVLTGVANSKPVISLGKTT
jgi:3-hydroxymyristoyl/3-hydroxydecanoyl-(acyl carrier protein) dehydratase